MTLSFSVKYLQKMIRIDAYNLKNVGIDLLDNTTHIHLKFRYYNMKATDCLKVFFLYMNVTSATVLYVLEYVSFYPKVSF
jgi:hypothetical protein